ncbi:hypothetical protein NXS19_006616 [Fusarium pseudograminearum]|nr:hypothetical protein NXS19_006616 [Fusarium pseudograminearum]
MTAESLDEGIWACKTEPEAFAEEALELIYEQNGGKTLLADTDGMKKGTIIFTSTLGVLRRNSDYMANRMTSITSALATRGFAKKHSKYGVHCIHAVSVGRIVDGDTEETRTGKHMRAEDVGQMYLWLSQQPGSLWVHELELRPAQEPILKFKDSYLDY